jgi:protein phosphatase
MAKLRIGSATDTGQVRTTNEDSLVVAAPVFAVADGMGGHLAGEVASAIAVDTLRARLAGGEAIPSADRLVATVKAANVAILQAARTAAERRGMGTTLTALALLAPETGDGPLRLALANVGDSRAYVIRAGVLKQLSIDHSYVHELVATGQITPDEARFHPNRNIVTRALGIEPDVRVDAWTFPLVRGDRFLLCSDGLVDEVLDDTICEQLAGIADPQAAADSLVATANRHGGRDNITVVIVDVIDGIDPPDDPLELAVEPHWAEGEGEAAFSDDLRLDDTPPAPPAFAVPISDTTPVPGIPRAATEPTAARPRRFTWRTLVFLFAVAAVFVAAFSMTAVYARTGYFVGFDQANVAVYKGRPGGVLWFDPTVEVRTPRVRAELTPSDITIINSNLEFSSLDGAIAFIEGIAPDPAATATTVVAEPSTTISGTGTSAPTTPAPAGTGASTTVPGDGG